MKVKQLKEILSNPLFDNYDIILLVGSESVHMRQVEVTTKYKQLYFNDDQNAVGISSVVGITYK